MKNIQGECLWIHDGRGLGIIRNKYEFRRTPDNGMHKIVIISMHEALSFIKSILYSIIIPSIFLFFALH